MRPFCFLIFLAGLLSACSTTQQNEPKRKLSHDERARVLVELANGALVEGDPIGALANLREAEKYNPKLPEIHHSKALAYFARRELDLAVSSASQAVTLNPKFSDANNTLGRLLLDRGKLKEAEPYLRAAANDPLYRNSYKAQTNLGILYYRNQRHHLAEVQFSNAIINAPGLACDAYYYRGNIVMKRKDAEKAIRDYEKAIKGSCGDFAEAHYALGLAFLQSGRADQARTKFLEVTQLYPESQVANKAMARLRTLP